MRVSADRWVDGLRAGDPRAVQAGHRLLARMGRRSFGLTVREREALQRAADLAGARSATDKKALASARLKLGARNTTHAVALAWRDGLIV